MSRSSFVPVALAGDGKWLVSGSKFDSSGNIIEDNDTNALYLYDPATKEFSEKLYEDGTYDVGGFTGGCRPGGSISANVNKKTNKLRSLTYAADKPVTIYFDDESNAVNDEVDDEDKEGFLQDN